MIRNQAYYKKFYNDHKDDLALIGNKIEEHDHRVIYDEDLGEFKKVQSGITYFKCKDPECALCKEIKALAGTADETAFARVVSRGAEKLTMYSIIRMVDRGMSLAAIARLFELESPEDLTEIVHEEIKRDELSVEAVVRLFRNLFEIPTEIMYQLIPFTPEDVLRALRNNSNLIEPKGGVKK